MDATVDSFYTERAATPQPWHGMLLVDGQPACSAGFVGRHEAWTAWHCVDHERPVSLRIGYVLGESCYPDAVPVDIRQITADRALLTFETEAPAWIEPCNVQPIAGLPSIAYGYPMNYDGGEVPQELHTSTVPGGVMGDWGPGGSGALVTLEGKCAFGVLSEIISSSSLSVRSVDAAEMMPVR